MRSPGVALVRGSSILLQLLFVSLVPRFAGTEAAGYFFSTYAAILITSSISRFGAEYYLVAFLPRTDADDRSLRITALNLMIGVVACTLFAVSLLMQAYSSVTVFGGSTILLALFWAAVLLLSLNWSNVGTIRGLGDHTKSVSLEAFVYVTVFLVGLVALKSTRSPVETDLYMLLIGSLGVSVTVGGVYAFRFGIRFAKPGIADITRSIREAVSFWLASALSVANAWLPVLLLGLLAPPEDVSTYLLGQRLAASVLFGLTILNARFARDYAHLNSTGEISELRALYRRNTTAQLPFVVAVALVLVIFSPYVFQFSGISDHHAYTILIVLGCGTVTSALCGPIVTASLATGHADAISKILGSTLLLSVGAMLLLSKQLDGLVMACIVAITMAAQNLVMYFSWSARLGSLAK